MSARAATSPAAGGEKGTPIRLTRRAAVLLFGVFLLAMVSIAPARVWLDQRARLHDLERQASELEAANAQLHERITDLQDPETLERLARECLGMVEPGEIAIIIAPRNEPPAPPDC